MYLTAKEIQTMLNIGQSTLALWWDKGLKREKRHDPVSRRMVYHTSRKDLESYLHRELSKDELAKIGK